MGADRLEIFAVEDSTVQLCWRALPVGPVQFSVPTPGGGVVLDTVSDGRPGAVVLEGLPPDTRLLVSTDVVGAPIQTLPVTTLGALASSERTRVATISDIHVGEKHFGHLPKFRESQKVEPYALRCARAAIAEALAWGAQLLVVKGDLTTHSSDAEYDAFAGLVSELPVPVAILPGNHDGGNYHRNDAETALARHGLELVLGVRSIDLPGLRVVLAHTVRPRQGHGTTKPVRSDLVKALEGSSGGVLLTLHHHFQRTVLPTHWPPGILGLDAHRTLGAVERANPAVLVTSGHTHRHRRRRHGSVVLTEVGSTKDYPGVWAGYEASADGIRQVVRRVAAPDAISWTDRTAGMGLGQWGRWSPGKLEDRCFVHLWPARP